MRSLVSAVARVMILGYAVVMAGCGGPEDGSQVKISDQEIQKRSQGIKDAMKSGMYKAPPGATKPAR